MVSVRTIQWPCSETRTVTLSTDSVVDEVRAARDAYASRFGYDLWAIYRDLKEQEALSDQPLVSLPPRRICPEAIHGHPR